MCYQCHQFALLLPSEVNTRPQALVISALHDSRYFAFIRTFSCHCCLSCIIVELGIRPAMHLCVENEPEESSSKDGPTAHPFMDPHLKASIEAWPRDIPRYLGDPNEPQHPTSINGSLCECGLPKKSLSEEHVCQGEQSELDTVQWPPLHLFTIDSILDHDFAPFESSMSRIGNPISNRIERMMVEHDTTFQSMSQATPSKVEPGDWGSERAGSRQGGSSSRGYVKSLSIGTARSTTTYNDLNQRSIEENVRAAPGEQYGDQELSVG